MIPKHRILCKLLCIICLVALMSVLGTCLTNCSTDAEGKRWILMQSYEFENGTKYEDWRIQDELVTNPDDYSYCESKPKNKVSCDNMTNVQVNSGYLVLRVPQTNFSDYVLVLGHDTKIGRSGRLEMRIQLNEYDILNMKMEPIPKELSISGLIGLRFSSMRYGYETASNSTDKFNTTSKSLWNHWRSIPDTGFYIIGIEWSSEQLRYFINEKYSSNVLSNKSKNRKEPPYYFTSTIMATERACPSTIIDYIRIFQSTDVHDCDAFKFKMINKTDEQEIIDQICSQSENPNRARKLIVLILVIGILIVLCLVAYCIRRIQTLGSLVEKNNETNHVDDIRNEHDNHLHDYDECKDDDNYYEVFYEDGDDESAEYLDVENAPQTYSQT